MIPGMVDVIVLGEGDGAAAALAEAVSCGIDAARPAWPVWSVVRGFRVDTLGQRGTVAMMAPRILALAGLRPAASGGSIPDWDVPRLLRAAMAFDARRSAWMPVRDAAGQTSIPGLFAAENEAEARAILRGMARGSAGFEAGPAARPPAEPALTMPLDGVVCPCEGVTRGAIEAAAVDGAHDLNQLRAFTRCGMGVCQGRQCEDLAAHVLGPLVGGRVAAGQWTMRPPLVPVPLDALMGSFAYDDIPVPPPAPP